MLSNVALQRAADAIAGQAECLADEMERGSMAGRDGPGALRLLAAVIRITGHTGMSVAAGH